MDERTQPPLMAGFQQARVRCESPGRGKNRSPIPNVQLPLPHRGLHQGDLFPGQAVEVVNEGVDLRLELVRVATGIG